jgi:uncharacterized protein YndB with AHSA1/START domain
MSSEPMNPETDLVLERQIAAPVERVWRAWTDPDLLKQWWAPRPWQTAVAVVDLRPGGEFRFEMRGPEGEESNHVGAFLEVVPQRRIVWSTAILPGFRPAPLTDFVPNFTAVIEFIPEGSGTRYRATAMHRDTEGRDLHASMGFHEGWGICADQLAEVAEGL